MVSDEAGNWHCWPASELSSSDDECVSDRVSIFKLNATHSSAHCTTICSASRLKARKTMGLHTNGSLLTYDEITQHQDYIKKHGIAQFIAILKRSAIRAPDSICLWGDELEYTCLAFDHEKKKVRVSLSAGELLARLHAHAELGRSLGVKPFGDWSPEHCAHMVESMPHQPYDTETGLDRVENNMRARRAIVNVLANAGESVLTLSYPSLGAVDFTRPSNPHRDEESSAASIFGIDATTFNGHPRYQTLVNNIRQRRDRKTRINIPIYRDTNTPLPFVEKFVDMEARAAALPDHIYMDHMNSGGGACCLQTTFQATNLTEARWLYDQLLPITPILAALSAATPIFRSYLADVDSRWSALEAGSDDRTRGEAGEAPLVGDERRLRVSRHNFTPCYVSESSSRFNDIPLEYSSAHLEQLKAGGVDETLARHVAHLFVRSPLVVCRDHIIQDDEKSTLHFDSINTSVWSSLRLKPPPLDSPSIGWRVEVRPMDVQVQDAENAALCSFIMLLTRAILSLKLDFRLPVSLASENMRRAQRRDAVLEERFHFACRVGDKEELKLREMTVDEIVNGCSDFAGLVPLIRRHTDKTHISENTRRKADEYLAFVSRRASGETPTIARWMRNFVAAHADYKHDARVPDSTIYDMLRELDAMSKGAQEGALLDDLRVKDRKATSIGRRRASIQCS